MASKRKLEVEEAPVEESKGTGISFEESCVIVTTLALICGIICILWKLGVNYDAGPFAG